MAVSDTKEQLEIENEKLKQQLQAKREECGYLAAARRTNDDERGRARLLQGMRDMEEEQLSLPTDEGDRS